MLPTKGYAIEKKNERLKPFSFERREPNQDDVVIDIQYCGICHSDVHQVLDEWNKATYPMVPGHEIVGMVREVGSKVSRFKPGDKVGVGCLVDSCRTCNSCQEHLEQYCDKSVKTYNDYEHDGKTPTFGGYSDTIVVKHDFVVKVPENMDLAATAPLLCAGITTYSPMKFFNIGPETKIGIIGLGGLGHVAIKTAKAMGAHTTLFTHSVSKVEAGYELGADHVQLTKDQKRFDALHMSLDVILNTASADLDITPYLNTLKRDGVFVLLGVPQKPLVLKPSSVILQRKMIAGSLIGGLKETQEMLDFCHDHNILCDIELIKPEQINEAYERMLKGDVKYRFVIDCKAF